LASTQSKLLHILLRMVNKKNFLKGQFIIGKLDFFNCSEPPSEIAATCHIDKYQLNGHNVFTLKPRIGGCDKHILYLHGGAYVASFVKQHWRFLRYLVDTLKCTITAPDYPLAPTYTYKEAFAMLVPLYKELISKIDPYHFILMGDSAGGGFALALAQKMKEEHVKQPEHIILLSPWLDISLTNPEIKSIDPFDPFLGLEGLQRAGKAYAGSTRLDHYLLSPLYGSIEGLGRISLFIGSKEILVADARKLKIMAQSKDVHFEYFEYEDMVHVWMLLNLPESKKARLQIVDIIQHS
jgi:epsilon-lactone hydrolase